MQTNVDKGYGDFFTHLGDHVITGSNSLGDHGIART